MHEPRRRAVDREALRLQDAFGVVRAQQHERERAGQHAGQGQVAVHVPHW